MGAANFIPATTTATPAAISRRRIGGERFDPVMCTRPEIVLLNVRFAAMGGGASPVAGVSAACTPVKPFSGSMDRCPAGFSACAGSRETLPFLGREWARCDLNA